MGPFGTPLGSLEPSEPKMGNCFSSQRSSSLVNTNPLGMGPGQGPVGVMGTGMSGMTSLHSHVGQLGPMGPQGIEAGQIVNGEGKPHNPNQVLHLQGNPLVPGMMVQGGGPLQGLQMSGQGNQVIKD